MGIFYIVCEENEDRGLVWAGSQFISKDIGFVENVLKTFLKVEVDGISEMYHC